MNTYRLTTRSVVISEALIKAENEEQARSIYDDGFCEEVIVDYIEDDIQSIESVEEGL